jgi:hypothetical protein
MASFTRELEWRRTRIHALGGEKRGFYIKEVLSEYRKEGKERGGF